jgi:hypothetical protein
MPKNPTSVRFAEDQEQWIEQRKSRRISKNDIILLALDNLRQIVDSGQAEIIPTADGIALKWADATKPITASDAARAEAQGRADARKDAPGENRESSRPR